MGVQVELAAVVPNDIAETAELVLQPLVHFIAHLQAQIGIGGVGEVGKGPRQRRVVRILAVAVVSANEAIREVEGSSEP